MKEVKRMEIKEAVVDAFVPVGRGTRRRDETWHIVKFGDKEFLMPKTASKEFTKKMCHEAEFSFYFDGDKLIINNKQHIPVETVVRHINLNKCYFIVLQDNVELFKPENLTLLAKENGLALYTINDYDIPTIYRNGNIYRVIDCDRVTITFDKEKPLNDETYNLLKRLAHYHKAKYIKVDGKMAFFKIRILDDNDVSVYTTEDTNEHQIFVIENAEFAKIYDDMFIAIKGGKTYIVIERLYNPATNDIIKIGETIREHKNEYIMYEYIIPDTIKVLNKETKGYNVNDTAIVSEKTIIEIPSADSEIIVRKLVRKAEPTDVDNKDCETIGPDLMEEKTYKIRDFVNKPTEIGFV
jgi:hypothetical protein